MASYDLLRKHARTVGALIENGKVKIVIDIILDNVIIELSVILL